MPVGNGIIRSVTSALNGRLIAFLDDTLTFYDIEKKRRFEVKRIGEAGALRWAFCIPTGNLCAGSNHQNIFVWRLIIRQGDIVAEPLAKSFEFSPYFDEKTFGLTEDEQLLVYNRKEGRLLVWDLAKPDDSPKKLELSEGAPSCLAVSPANKTLVLGYESGVTFRQLDKVSEPPITLSFPEGTYTYGSKVNQLIFSLDGSLLAVGNTNGTTVLIDVATHSILGETLRDSGPEMSFVPQDTYQTLLVTGNAEGRIMTWEIHKTGVSIDVTEGKSRDYKPGIYSLDTLYDKTNTLVIGGGDGALALWDTSSKPLLDRVEFSLGKEADHLLFDASGTLLLHHSTDGDQAFFEFSDSQFTEILSPTTHKGVKSARFPPWVFTEQIFTEANSGVFIVDPMKPSLKPKKLPIKGDGVRAAAINAKGSILAVGTKLLSKTGAITYQVVLWDFRNKSKPKRLRTIEYGEEATSAAFSRDSRLLAVGYNSGRIILWDVATAKKVTALASLLTVATANDAAVISLAFSPDGKTLASSSLYRSLDLWDTSSSVLIGTLESDSFRTFRDDHAHSLVFSPSGKKLIASTPLAVKVWDTDPFSWAKRARAVANRLTDAK
ncbi:MAG TPA: WD40 repeat domain-containing protein [Pyrinomonadaceae bacterium]